MKNLLILAAALLFAAPAIAQTEVQQTTQNPTTGAKSTTEVDVRSNGTVKTETTTRTGRTKAGEAVHEAGQDTKVAGKKVAHGTKKVGKKAVHGVKKGANKVENKVEKAVD